MFKRISIQSKLISALILQGIVLLAVGGVGWYSTTMLSNSLNFITGPAWDTADGAMEGTIGIQSQMIAVEKILLGHPFDEQFNRLKQGQKSAEEALERLSKAGLMSQDQLSTFSSAKKEYYNQLETLINAHSRYVEIKSTFKTNTDDFVDLGELLEEIGDGAVQELEQTPDVLLTWSDDIKPKWQAADGAMEANIGLLWGLYELSNLSASTESDPEIVEFILESLEFQQEASESMLATGRFNIQAGTRWGNTTYASAYAEYFERHKSLITELSGAIVKYHEDLISYNRAANKLLSFISEFEEQGDATVEGQIEGIATTVNSLVSSMIFVLSIGLGISVLIVLMIQTSIIKPIKSIQYRVSNIAQGEGDLTARLKVQSQDELGQLSSEFNTFIEHIHSIIKLVLNSCENMNSSMTQMQSNTSAVSEKVSNQKQHTDSIAQAFEELSSCANNIAQLTLAMTESANEAKSTTDEAQLTVHKTIDSIKSLSSEINAASNTVSSLEKEVGSIVSVLDVIIGIAEQTNLLALNAAIEAARAGEQGRGFAVVADEVRALASKTQASTAEIQETINRLKSGSQNAVQAMNRSREQSQVTVEQSEEVSRALNSIANKVGLINESNMQVASASEEQTAVSKQMSENVEGIVSIALDTEENMRVTETSSRSVSQKTAELNEVLNRFKV